MSSSTMRLSGMISGMDTDSIISQLVEVKQTKIDDQYKKQTQLSWKQDIWKDLNSEIKKLQTQYAATMRMSSAYAAKKTTVSDSSVASVIAGNNAVNSVQSLGVESLAKSGYLTGGEVSTTDDEDATALSTLADLGFSGASTIRVSGDDEGLAVTEDTTISDVLTYLKGQGLNASFDADNQRIFVSSKSTGADSDFDITADDATGAAALNALGILSEDVAEELNDTLGLTGEDALTATANKIDGQNAVIYLNGAKFTSNSNTFSINGLTITVNEETGKDSSGNLNTVTMTTTNDTSGMYDKIKSYLEQYNTVINKIYSLYNAEDSSDYEPLTDDEKYAMSEKEIEEYEEKAKEGLLRRDSNLYTLLNRFSSAFSSGYEVDGETLYLSNFGIKTLSYFSSDADERYALHIDGDADDDATSGNEDKLAAMIASDPDKVQSFFSQLSSSLYDTMFSLSKSVDGYRSYGSFYDDKKMTSDYTDYTEKIAEMEEKLNDYEDKLYSKYSKMETALAKLQSKTSAISGLLG